MLGHAAENQFAKSRMTVRARDDDTCADVGGYRIQLNCDVMVHAGVGYQFGGSNAVARQPGHNIPDRQSAPGSPRP